MKLHRAYIFFYLKARDGKNKIVFTWLKRLQYDVMNQFSLKLKLLRGGF